MSLTLLPVPTVPISLARLESEPLAVWHELRQDHPVAYVPVVGLTLVTRHADVEQICRDADAFSAQTPTGPLSRVLGANFMHADGAQHWAVRQHLAPLMRAGAMRQDHEAWLREQARRLVAGLGPRIDVMAELAHPLATAFLSRLTGVIADEATFERWFRSIAAGAANFEEDPAKQERAEVASREIDEAVRAVRRADPNAVVPALARAGLGFAEIASTVKLFVIGGLQEPRDLLGFTVLGLTKTGSWGDRAGIATAIEEASRWGSPVGTVTRTVVVDAVVGGHHLPAGTRVAAVIAAANHDPERWTSPDLFDPQRRQGAHLAYGNGPHSCVGAAASRLLVKVAMEELMIARPALSLLEEPTVTGYEFRGPQSVRVAA